MAAHRLLAPATMFSAVEPTEPPTPMPPMKLDEYIGDPLADKVFRGVGPRAIRVGYALANAGALDECNQRQGKRPAEKRWLHQ